MNDEIAAALREWDKAWDKVDLISQEIDLYGHSSANHDRLNQAREHLNYMALDLKRAYWHSTGRVWPDDRVRLTRQQDHRPLDP